MHSRFTGLTFALASLAFLAACESQSPVATPATLSQPVAAGTIEPYAENPRYWQYRGEPALLLGGTREDNLFQIDDLEEHLDLLADAGGNYIRNTMSSRDEGNLWPFAEIDNAEGDGPLYDLDQFDQAYWDRFDRMLQLTHERGIIVQIELWDFWDFFNTYGDGWSHNPWNPANNVNYSTDDTYLATSYEPPSYSGGETHGELHDFFRTIPAKNDDEIVLAYQQRFIDRLLEHTLEYDHVLFCVTNEIHQPQPLAWSVYWAEYVRERAAERDRRAYVTEMFWVFDFAHEQHQPAIEDAGVFDYFEASQNSAINDAEANWDNLQYAWQRLADDPRPINHTKMYGSDDGPSWAGSTDDVVQQFWRNIVGGAAASRFHRPDAGIGLSETAQHQIAAARALQQRLDVFSLVPDSNHARLGNRDQNEAYLAYEPGRQYAVYFPDGGSVALDLTDAEGELRLQWFDIEQARWQDVAGRFEGNGVILETPDEGPWVALVTTVTPPEDGEHPSSRWLEAGVLQSLVRSDVVSGYHANGSFESSWLDDAPGYAEAAEVLGEYLEAFGNPSVEAAAQSWQTGRVLTEAVEAEDGNAFRLLFHTRYVAEIDDSRLTGIELLPADEAAQQFDAFIADPEAVHRPF